MPADNPMTVGTPEMDGGVIDAAAAIAAIPGFDDGLGDPSLMPSPAHPADPVRAPNGQFRAQKAAAQPVKPPAPVIDLKTGAEMQPGDEPAEEASDPAEEFFELPPEKEGGEPVRLKATEVWEGYNEAKQLRARVAELEKGVPPPEVYDQELMRLVDAQAQMLQRLQVYEQYLQPEAPDLALIDEYSPRYNPGAYQRQMAIAQQQNQQINAIRQQMQAVDADRQRRVDALSHLQKVRGREALAKFWPEVVASDGKEAARVRSEVADYYGQFGVTPEVMASITNPGFYAVLKDALAYRRGQRERETAIRVVRSKPRLVRGSARSGDTARQQAYQAGMQRLSKSNSVEDAAQALAGLI